MKETREPPEGADATARIVVDAAIEVHRVLGPGYAEAVYDAALCHELRLRRVAFERQRRVSVHYKGAAVGDGWLDLLVQTCVVVELKATPHLVPAHIAQVISYLKATGLSLGLVLNFGEAQMRTGIRRVVLTETGAGPPGGTG